MIYDVDVSLGSLDGMNGMTLEGEYLRNEEMEREDVSFSWHADILTYSEFWEVEMMYVFRDPNEELFTELENSSRSYNCELTDSVYYPSMDNHEGETFVLAYLPIRRSLDHEVAEFPGEYLEELRDGFYDQVLFGEQE